MALCARLAVADFSDQDHVGVVAQDAAEPRGERQPDLRMDWIWQIPFRLVLDRVFDRDDLSVGAFDFVERAVERGAFARAGGARDEHDAVGHVDQLAEDRLDVGGMPTFFRLNCIRSCRATHHDPSPCIIGDADADVDLAPLDAELDAAVLRQPLLRDVQVRHVLRRVMIAE